MNKLEQKIKQALEDSYEWSGAWDGKNENYSNYLNESLLVENFMKIALEIAEKSWYDGRDSRHRTGFEDFKKEIL